MSRPSPLFPAGVAVTLLATAGYAVNSMNQQVIFLLGQQIKLDLRLGDAQLGFLFGLSYMAFSALAAVPLGWLADLYRRRYVIAVSLGVMAAASTFTALSRSFFVFVGLRALAGAGDGGIVPAGSAMIGASVPPKMRPLSLSIFNAGSAIGAFVCYRYAGAIAQAHGWRTAYLAVGLLGLAVAAIIAVATPDRPNRGERALQPKLAGTLMALPRLPAYRQIVLAFIATGFVSAASWSWTALVLQRGYGLSIAETGAFLSIAFGVATVAGSLLFGVVGSRLRAVHQGGPIAAGIGMQIGSAIFYLAGLSSTSAATAQAMLFVSLFFAGSGMVVVFDTLQEILPDGERATGVGLAMLLFSLFGQGLGPMFTGALSDGLAARLGASSLNVVVQWVMGLGSIWIVAHLALVMRALGRIPGSGKHGPAAAKQSHEAG